MNPLYIKSIHIIFVVTWFAGLFYIVRLFIYHTEANEKGEPDRSILIEQLSNMERLLWRVITAPSMVLATGSGLYLAYLYKYFTQGWMHIKLTLVFGLLLYHFACAYLMRQLQVGNFKYSSTQLRIWNEVATLFLTSIVFLVVLKNELSMVWGVIGFFSIAVILMIAIKLYKRFREKQTV